MAQSHIHLRFTRQAWHLWSPLVAGDAAALCVAGVALGDIYLGFAWQAWHLETFTFGLRGRRGTYGTAWRAWSPLVAGDAAALCVAGVALADIHLRFAWQAWHLGTSTFVSRGRHGAISHPPSFHAAGVALMALRGALGRRWSPVTPRHFAWQAWHKETSTLVLRGRRGTYGTAWRAWSPLVAGDAAALCVAGVALGDIHLWFAWQAWHKETSTLVLRGRRGTYGTAWRAWSPLVAGDAAALCVAGMALADIHLRFAWQAWHLETFTFGLRGRRGTRRHPPWFCVAGVALMALRGALGRRWSPLVAGDAAALCVAGVALADIHLRFAWQAWHLETSTFVSRGRRGTISHPPSFCVAGVALMALRGALGRRWSPVTPRHFAWQAWHLETFTFGLRGRRGTRRHLPWFCVAGVALIITNMALRGVLGRRWSPVTPRHFAWQAWHLLTSTFVLRGRRGTWRHLPWFCVAGVAQGDIHLRFAWQAWHLWHCVARLVAAGRR